MADVVIIQEHLPHYRVAFFEGLRESLAGKGISLGLVHGKGSDSRMLTTPLPWATGVNIRRLGPFSWHSLGGICRGSRLVIVPQETKYLRCHLLWLHSRIHGRPKFAYWGHGRNFQAADTGGAAERFKGFLTRRVDWWFAYNDLSARVVRDLGFPEDRITSIGNTIDTLGLIRRRECVEASELEDLRAMHGIDSEHVALFNGAIYAPKRIGFLLEAARLVRQRIPDFTLLVIGEGPERQLVREAAAEHPWIHDLGPMKDEEKVPYWMLSRLLLMPGLVGLVIVDSFALGVPMVTTDYPHHSPEIDYLEDGKNGVLVKCGESAGKYAEAVAALMEYPAETARLAEGASRAARTHTMEEMIERFSAGVTRALANP